MDGSMLRNTLVPLAVYGAVGAGVGLGIEYVVVKPMSRGNQDWAIPTTYALLGLVFGAMSLKLIPQLPGM